MLDLVAEFISPKKCSFIVGTIIPKSVKCIHSATKLNHLPHDTVLKVFRRLH